MRHPSTLISLALAAVACSAASPATAGPAEDQYKVAAGHYGRGRYQLAVQEFEQFLQQYEQHPQAPEARFFLGEALMQLGQVAQARSHFDAFATAEPEHRLAPRALFRRGECAYLTGDYAAARKFLEQFHTAHGQHELNAYALPYLGDLALMDADGANAQRYYTQALREHGKTTLAEQCRFGLARALQMQRRYDDAQRFYQAVSNKPNSPLADDALLHLGRMRYEQQQYDEALKTWAKLIADHPESDLLPYVQYWTGRTQLAKDETDAAIAALQKAAAVEQTHPLTPAIRFQLGEAFRRAGRLEEAAAHFQLVVDQAPDSTWLDDATHGLLRLASDTNQHEAAGEVAQRFLENHPQSPLAYDARRMLGRAQLKLGKYETSAETLNSLLTELDALLRGNADGQLTRSQAKTLADSTRYLLGLAYVGAKEFDQADRTIAALEPDEENEPDLAASIYAVRAAALIGEGKYAEAVAPLRSYLRLNPEGADANKSRAQLAVALAQTKRLDEAQRIYDELTQEYTDRAEFLETTYILAEAAFRAGEKAWARELFTTLADENNPPEFREKGLSGKAWCELDLKAPVRSAETFARLLSEFPDSPLAPEAALARAAALEQAGEHDAALAMYSLVINEHPDSKQMPQALYRAAKLQDVLQQDKQAEKLLKRYIEEYPQRNDIDAALYRLAWVLKDQKRDGEAAEVFTRIHRDYKDSRFWADATYRLAERAAIDNDYEQVARLVDEIVASGTTHDVLSHALYLKGQTAAKLGRWEEVAAPLRQLLAQFSNSPLATSAKYWIAESFYRREKFAEAAEQFAQLARDTQGQDDTWLAIIPLRRAQVLAQQRKWAAAYALVENLAEKHPGFSQQYEADYLMGRCLANQARFDDARAAYERVVNSPHGRRTETAAMAQWNIGETYFHQKDYENAIRAYSRVELLYDFPRWQALSLLQAGKCYEMLGKWDEAIDSYRQIAEQFPNTEATGEAARRLQVASERAKAARQAGSRDGSPANNQTPRDARDTAQNDSR